MNGTMRLLSAITVFFCSAYNDVSHILALIERKQNNENLIIVVNNYNCFEYLRTLNINNTELFFISSKLRNLKKPSEWIKERANIRSINNNILRQIKKSEVVFFALFYDLLTCKCIDILKDSNKIYLSLHSEAELADFQSCQKVLVKDKLLSRIYKLRFHSYINLNRNVTGLPLSYIKKYLNTDLNAEEEELQFVRNKYATKMLKDNKPFILFLDAEANYNKTIINYFQDISKILNMLKNYNIYAKGHPRVGVSKIVRSFNLGTIESSIPIEFLDFSNCKCVIGLESIALANIANSGVNVISLLKYFDYKNANIRTKWIKYLERLCNSEIHYPETLNNIKGQLQQFYST
jgi:hypothetical protein